MMNTVIKKVKADERTRAIIRNGLEIGQRSIFVISGDKPHDQVITQTKTHIYVYIKCLLLIEFEYGSFMGFFSSRLRSSTSFFAKKKAIGTLYRKKLFGATRINLNFEGFFLIFFS